MSGADDGERRARHLVVSGRVQGVFFRASLRRRANAHGVTGWTANRRDGRVEAWLEGPTEAVAAVEDWVHAGGPRDAEVREVEAADADAAGHDRFEVR